MKHFACRKFNLATPRFTTDFPGAVIREGADELTLRAREEGVSRTSIDATNVGNERWWPPLVDDSYRIDSSRCRCYVPATMHSSLPLRHPGGKSQTAGGLGTGQLHHGVDSDFSRSG